MFAMPSIQGFSAFRARSYVLRLPLFTRVIVVVIFAVWVLGLQNMWDLQQWGALIPSQITFATGTCTFEFITIKRRCLSDLVCSAPIIDISSYTSQLLPLHC